MASVVLHLADLHIGGVPLEVNRFAFEQVFAIARKITAKSFHVLIAGDIFHRKTQYSGDDIEDFHYLMNGLKSFPVLIIPGNHDINLARNGAMDLLTPLVRHYPNVAYWLESRQDTFCGVYYTHVSVKDPATSGDIMSRASAASILLYHGEINGAKYGRHVVRDSRITREIISRFAGVFAGDVHEHQFITPECAYPGGLTQQNIAESQTKGLIIWTIEPGSRPRCSGAFMSIPQSRVLVNLDIRGKTREEIAALCRQHKTARVSRVQITTDAGPEVAGAQIAQVRDVLGRVDNVHNTKLTPPPSGIVVNFDELLVKSLEEAGAAKLEIDTILLDYHRQSSPENRQKWNIESLSFDYMFRYGPGNHIDFSAISGRGGISGVIAPNRAGKSSIIDVVVFGLFGEFLRGDRKSAIRNGANEARLSVTFAVGSARYRISRVIGRASQAIFKLYELPAKTSEKQAATAFPSQVFGKAATPFPSQAFGKAAASFPSQAAAGPGAAKDAGEEKDITEVSADATNRKIRGLIGTLDQFLATGLYCEASGDLIRTMTPGARAKYICEMLGLNNEAVVRRLKAEIKDVRARIAEVPVPRRKTSPEDELRELAVGVAAKREARARLEARITADDAAHFAIRGSRSRDEITANITAIDARLSLEAAELARILPRITGEPCSARVCVISAEERARLAAIAGQTCRDIAIIRHELSLIKNSAPPSQAAAELPGTKNSCTGKTAGAPDLEKTRAKLAAIREQIGNTPTTMSVEELTEAQAILGAKLANLKLLPESDAAKTLTIQIGKLRVTSILKYSDTCPFCQINKCQISKNLAQAEQDLRVENEKAAKIRAANAITEASLRELEAEKEKLAVAGRKYSLLGEARALEQQIQAEALRAELKYTEEITAAKLAIASADQYQQYLFVARKNEIQSNGPTLKTHRAELCAELAKIPEGVAGKLRELEARLAEDKKKLADLLVSLGSAERTKTVLEEELAIYQKYGATVPQLNEKLRVLKLHANVLSTGKFRNSAMCEYVGKLVARANQVLAGITDFELASEIDENSVEFYVREDEKRIPACLCSGFQKFVISIAMRLSMVSAIPAAPRFIMIDEGFGCLDSENLTRIGELFAGLAGEYSFIFCISHIDALQEMITTPLYIIQRRDNTIGAMCSSIIYHVGGIPLVEYPTSSRAIPSARKTCVCECGAEIAVARLKGHLSTQKHANAMKKFK